MKITVHIGGIEASRQISGIVERKLARAAMLIEPAQRAGASANVVVRESPASPDGQPQFEAVCDATVYGRTIRATALAPGVFSAIRQMKQRLAWQILEIGRGADNAPGVFDTQLRRH